MDDEQWSWQEPGTAWKGIGIYHVTLTITSRQPLLDTLVIPDNDPTQAKIERTELGNALVEKLLNHPNYYSEVQIVQYCLMPDHLHVILNVKRPMTQTFNTVVRSLWQAAKKLGRAYNTPSINPESDSGLTNGEDTKVPFPIFTERPFVRPMSRQGQLQTMIHYVQMNPQRLLAPKISCEILIIYCFNRIVQKNLHISKKSCNFATTKLSTKKRHAVR